MASYPLPLLCAIIVIQITCHILCACQLRFIILHYLVLNQIRMKGIINKKIYLYWFLCLIMSLLLRTLFILHVYLNSYLVSFQFRWRNSLSFSYRTGLLTSDSIRFCSSGNILMLLSFWKDSFAGYRVFLWHSFFLSQHFEYIILLLSDFWQFLMRNQLLILLSIPCT